ncbi:MAG: DUF4388 domain-containing protein [Myxococcota bacterium]
MSVSLRGNLKDFGIAEIFQLIGQQRKTGILEFRGQGERIQCLFDRGAVVSAAHVGLWSHAALGEMLLRCGLLTRDRVEDLRRECEASAQMLPGVAIARGWLEPDELRQIEELLTGETIFSVLRWQAGSFDFTAQEVVHDRDFDSLLGAEQILMDGLRMVDEWHSFAELVPSEDTVFQRTGSFSQYIQRAGSDGERQREMAERVHSLVDGRLTARRIIDLSLLGTFNAVRSLAGLHRVRVIEPVDPAGLERLQQTGREVASRLPKAGSVGAAVIPLAVLLIVTLFAQVDWYSEPTGVLRIDRPTQIELVRDTFETRRVRHALETYYFSEGHWPADLEALRSSGTLASAIGGPYYYASRDDGAWLLGPDR